MESVSFGPADIAGPAVAGVLIAAVGATTVLGIDAATYAVFVVVLLSLPRQPVPVRDPRSEACACVLRSGSCATTARCSPRP